MGLCDCILNNAFTAPSIDCFLDVPRPKLLSFQRLRWSRGSALPLSTQVRGFKPGQSRQDFQGRKILSAPSFGGEVKPSVSCRRFMACKRFLNVAWKSTFRQNYRSIYSPTSSTFCCLDLSRRVDVETPGGESGNVQNIRGVKRVAQ